MNIFSYESKFSQTLMFVADLAIVNVFFILCCLPIITIGPAQAALYTAVRAINDPEDDRSPWKVFFSHFLEGFGTITAAWLIFFVTEIALYFAITRSSGAVNVPTFWISMVAMVLVMLLHAQIPLFHSRFGCTVGQLIRNSFFLCLAHPLRSILTAALIWGPLILFFAATNVFLHASIAFFLLYYAVVFLVNFIVMKKPFNTLIEHYREVHGIPDPETETEKEDA